MKQYQIIKAGEFYKPVYHNGKCYFHKCTGFTKRQILKKFDNYEDAKAYFNKLVELYLSKYKPTFYKEDFTRFIIVLRQCDIDVNGEIIGIPIYSVKYYYKYEKKGVNYEKI